MDALAKQLSNASRKPSVSLHVENNTEAGCTAGDDQAVASNSTRSGLAINTSRPPLDLGNPGDPKLIACHICDANATYSSRQFFADMAGLKRHYIKVHPEVHKDNIHTKCKKLSIDATTLESILRGDLITKKITPFTVRDYNGQQRWEGSPPRYTHKEVDPFELVTIKGRKVAVSQGFHITNSKRAIGDPTSPSSLHQKETTGVMFGIEPVSNVAHALRSVSIGHGHSDFHEPPQKRRRWMTNRLMSAGTESESENGMLGDSEVSEIEDSDTDFVEPSRPS
jgi:hypothetical protein